MCQLAWCSRRSPEVWQAGMIIPIHKTRDRCEWINCRGISLASFTGIFYTKCLAKNAAKYFNVTGRCPVGFSSWREILGVCQQRLCYFCRPGESIGPVPRDKAWGALREYGVDGRRLLLAVRSLYFCSDIVSISGQPFTVYVGLRQRCVLSPLFTV